MIPLLSEAKVGGKPIDKKFIELNREEIVKEVKDFGASIIQKKGGTWWGPAQATVDIIDAIRKVREAGGTVLGEPAEIPGVGSYVAFLDTEGNRSCMLQPIPRNGRAPAETGT